MTKIFVVMRHEFLMLVTKPSYWIGLIGLPIFMGIIMTISIVGSGAATVATVSAKQNEKVIQGFVDLSGLIKTIPQEIQLRRYDDEASARANLASKQIIGYFIVPADYVTKGDVRYISPEFTPISSPTRQFERVLKLNLLHGDMTAMARADMTVTVEREAALAPVELKGGSGLPFPILPMFAGILFMIVMVTASSYLMQSVSTEKETRVMEVLMSSVTPTQLLAGKILGLGLVGLVQMGLWVLSSAGALNYIPTSVGLGTISAGSVLVAFVYFLLGYFTYAALMAGLGALMPGTREAAQYTIVIILPLLIPMYLITSLALEPNGPLSVALSLIPLTSPVAMVMRVTSTDVPLSQIILGIVLLSASAVLATSLVARLFRAQSLLSGSKPTLKQIVAAFK